MAIRRVRTSSSIFVMLCKVIPHTKTIHEKIFQERLVRLTLRQELHKFISFVSGFWILVRDPVEIFRRDGVDNRLVLFDPLLTVNIQNGFVGFAIPDPGQAFVEAATVDEAARDTHSSPGIAKMSSISCEKNSSHPKFWCATLMHFVGRPIYHFVLLWFGVAGKYGLKLPRLSFSVLFDRQTRSFTIRYPIQTICGQLGSHLDCELVLNTLLTTLGHRDTYEKVLWVDDKVGVRKSELPFKVIICLVECHICQ